MTLELSRLRQEHRVIAHAGEILRELLERAVGDGRFLREELEATAATYVLYYRNHLATEEQRILPGAATALTRADWDKVATAAPAMRDPLFGDKPEDRYRTLRRQIALET